MSNSDYSDLDAEFINITPRRKRERRNGGRIKWIISVIIFLLYIVFVSGVGFYTEAL